jgi:dehydrogenase/reductase SDR family protein 7
MSTERCAELMGVGIANKLDEMWISDHPELGLLYAAEYMPDIARL